MSHYGDDVERGRGGAPPPPYPQPHDPYQQYGGGYPPPPLGSALKRSGSQSRVPHLAPQFPDEQSYLGGNAPDLEAKQGRRHQRFRDRRDGYESDEGEVHRRGAPRGQQQQKQRGYDERSGGYDDRERPSRRKRGKDPPPGVEYGADPVPAMRRGGGRRRGARDDYYEDEYSSSEEEEDRRRPPPRKDDRRRRRDYYDDDGGRSEMTNDRRDHRRRERDRSRRRYDSSDSEYDERSRRGGRDRDRSRSRRRGDSAPPEIKIGDFDIGPLVAKGKTLAPVLAPIAMSMAKKYLGKR